MGLSPGEMHQRIIKNLPEKTGHDLSYWLDMLSSAAGEKSAQMRLLKNERGLGHYTAVAILSEFNGGNPWADSEALEARLTVQLSEKNRRIYEAMRSFATELPGVAINPCKTYVGFKAKRQFAVVKYSKRAGLEIGFALSTDSDVGLSVAKGLGGANITAKATAAFGEQKLIALFNEAFLSNS